MKLDVTAVIAFADTFEDVQQKRRTPRLFIFEQGIAFGRATKYAGNRASDLVQLRDNLFHEKLHL